MPNNGGREGLAYRGASCVLTKSSTQETPLRQAPHRWRYVYIQVVNCKLITKWIDV